MGFIENVNKIANALPETGFDEYEQRLTQSEEKLNGIAQNATKNQTDEYLRNRQNHTGTQSIDTITETANKKIMTKEERNKLALVDLNNPPAHLHSISHISGLQSILDSKSETIHNHDTRYYQKSEIDAITSGKSDINHIHDNRYFTQAQINEILTNYASILNTHTKAEITSFLNSKQDSNQRGVAGGYAPLDSNGKIPSSMLSDLSVVDVFEASSEANMLLLSNVGVGDLCVRSDLTTNNVFLLKQTPSSDLGNWIRLSFSATVASVNGMTGVVVITKSDIGLSNVDNTSDLAKPLSEAMIQALADKSSTGHTHDDRYLTKDELNILFSTKVSNSRKVNGHDLSEDVELEKADIGLSNVDNTSDLAKPLSTATQNAINAIDMEILAFQFIN